MERRPERTTRRNTPQPRWTQVVRGAGLGLRPTRLVVAWLAAVVACAIAHCPLPWLTGSPSLAALAEGGFAGGGGRGLWFAAFWEHPWTVAGVGAAVMIPVVLAMTGIARSVALEQATGRVVGVQGMIGFIAARVQPLVVAFVAPGILIAAPILLMAAVGAVLLRFPGVNIAGAVFYLVAVIVAAPVALLAAAMLIGWAMVPGSLAAEGAGTGEHGRGDGIDAFSRAVAYVFNGPVSLAWYGGIGLLLTGAAAWATGWVAEFAVTIARRATHAWLPEAAVRDLSPISDAGGTWSVARGIMTWSDLVPWTFAGGATLAVFGGVATMVYLLMRLDCDGQHPHDVWVAGSAVEPIEHAAPASGDDEE